MLSERITPRVRFDDWLAGLSVDNHATVTFWLTHPDLYSASAVAAAIRDDDPESDFTGYRANHDTIKNWRRRNGAE